MSNRAPISKATTVTAAGAMLYPVLVPTLVLLHYAITPKVLSKGTIAGIILASFLMLLASFLTLFIATISQGGKKKAAIICPLAGVVLNALFLITQGTV